MILESNKPESLNTVDSEKLTTKKEQPERHSEQPQHSEQQQEHGQKQQEIQNSSRRLLLQHLTRNLSQQQKKMPLVVFLEDCSVGKTRTRHKIQKRTLQMKIILSRALMKLILPHPWNHKGSPKLRIELKTTRKKSKVRRKAKK